MDKENVAYIANGILFTHGKEGNPTIATTWMDLEGIIHFYRQRKTMLYGITYCGI